MSRNIIAFLVPSIPKESVSVLVKEDVFVLLLQDSDRLLLLLLVERRLAQSKSHSTTVDG